MPIPRYRSGDIWPPLSAGFRPFFLVAGLWACVAMGIWVLTLYGIAALPTQFGAVTWHYHEMLFGFVAAAIAGFLLTAIPNWTGRMPLQGGPLGVLVLLWFAGRIAVAYSARTGPWVALVLDLAFLVVCTLVVSREILAGRNWRNLPVVLILSLFTLANAMIHAGAFGHLAWQGAGERLAIALVVMLISLIGGRIIPSFTTNWLRQRKAEALPAPFGRFDLATLAVSGVGLIVWVIAPSGAATGVLLIIAAAAHVIRLIRWRGSATRAEPLLWVLHVGYTWIPAGLFVLGLAVWNPALYTTAIHALTVGGMGTMILAVMTRATLGHSKRPLTAGRATLAVYLLVLVAAVARTAAPLLPAGYATALDIASGAWIAAFGLFVVRYAPYFLYRTR